MGDPERQRASQRIFTSTTPALFPTPPCTRHNRKARLLRALKAAPPAGPKGKLTKQAAAALARDLRAAALEPAALQQHVDAYATAAWAALGPSYLEQHEREVLGGARRASMAPAAAQQQQQEAEPQPQPEQQPQQQEPDQPQQQQEQAPQQQEQRRGRSAAVAAAEQQQQPAAAAAGTPQAQGRRWLRSAPVGDAPPTVLRSLPKAKLRGLPAKRAAEAAAAAAQEQQQQQQTPASARRGQTPGRRTPARAAAAGGSGDAGAGPSGAQALVRTFFVTIPAAFLSLPLALRKRAPFFSPLQLTNPLTNARPRKKQITVVVPGGDHDAGAGGGGGDAKRRKTCRWTPEETDAFVRLVYQVRCGERGWVLSGGGGRSGQGGSSRRMLCVCCDTCSSHCHALQLTHCTHALNAPHSQLANNPLTQQQTPPPPPTAQTQHGPGNWKAVHEAGADELNARTVVDLKDKWRNLEAGGRVLRDRAAQLRAVGLL